MRRPLLLVLIVLAAITMGMVGYSAGLTRHRRVLPSTPPERDRLGSAPMPVDGLGADRLQ